MILLLGASGFVGHAFASELFRRRYEFIPLTRKAIDYSNFNLLFDYVRKMRPQFLINAAGYTGRPNEDACELAQEETLAANILLPQTIARACLMTNTPWGHISSGNIYAGAKVVENGKMRIEKNLNLLEVRKLLTEHPERVFGFNEWDSPNVSFRSTPCSFYSGTKALAEEAIQEIGRGYIWRPGLPFNSMEEPRNFLWRIQQSARLQDRVISLSHVDDFVRACLNLWEREAPTGIYNVANKGAATTHQIVQMIQRTLKTGRQFDLSNGDGQTSAPDGTGTISHCVLDTTKLGGAGVKMRPIVEALEDSLRNWQYALKTNGMNGSASLFQVPAH
jgi:dTDP-4-dehydrorhamnose reductase